MPDYIRRLGPEIWSHLQASAAYAPEGQVQPLAVRPFTGRSPLRPGRPGLSDWEYIARYLAAVAPERPYSMAIGLAGDQPVGYIESDAPTPATCRAGVALLRDAGADGLITLCRPTPGGVLHVRSLLAARWWERAAGRLPITHAYFGPELDRPAPFPWPEGGALAAAPSDSLAVRLNPVLTPAQQSAVEWLQHDPGAPLRYLALLGELPVGVANVSHSPLGDYGEDGAARWSIGQTEPVCRIRWLNSALMGWGIGSLLYAQIEADALAAGIPAIVLEVAPFTTTDRFWSRHGFHPVPRDPQTPYRYMEKLLPSMGRPAPPLSA